MIYFAPILGLRQCNCVSWDLLGSFLDILDSGRVPNSSNVKYMEFFSKAILRANGPFYSNFGSKTKQLVIVRSTEMLFRKLL